METKEVLDEKRVKSTVIRRRVTVVEVTKPAVPEPSAAPHAPVSEKTAAEKGAKATPASPEAEKAAVAGLLAIPKVAVSEEELEKAKPKKAVRKKSKAELEMDQIARAGGLKKFAIIETTEPVEPVEKSADKIEPEKMDRVFQPVRGLGRKKKLVAKKGFKKTEITTPKAAKRVIRVEGMITVGDLAKRMSVKLGDLMKKLIDLGVVATVNQVLDHDTALLVAQDYGFELENVAFAEESLLTGSVQETTNKILRSPVVTVMGHVDHGKTTLLDTIRKTEVAAGEAGGITQHIGAYQVQTPKGVITFLDTPGHEAFTAMRARGAQVTDIVVIVVAADDGVMPQTVEAINHAKAAKVPIIVAVNKIDKPEANIEKARRSLMEQALVPEELGGDTIFVNVSAKKGTGVEQLLEMILLQAEVLELKSDPSQMAKGSVIEALLDKGRGPVVTVLVQEGTLHVGDPVVAGVHHGKVRALVNDKGENVREAGPSVPVKVLGLSGVPGAGDLFHSVSTEEDAREIASHRDMRLKEQKRVQAPRATLEELFSEVEKSGSAELKVIIKADVQGSSEAVREAISKLSTDKVRLTVIHTAVGGITESDVTLAQASKAIIIGFGVRPDTKARALAENEAIEIKTYSIIYEVIDDVKKAMVGLLAPSFKETYLGRAEVRQVFTVSKVGAVAGCSVVDGKIFRNAEIRLLRDGKVLYQGKISSLKRFKDDAREVTQGLECGIGIENYNDLKTGDLIEAFSLERIAGVL